MAANTNPKMTAALGKLLARHKGMRVNGKSAREQTDKKHSDVIYAAYSRLEVLGFKLQHPENIADKHLDALVKDWHARGLMNKTMQNSRSRLSIFFQRMGKSANFFKPLHEYLPGVDPKSLKVIASAQSSKSWTELGIPVIAKIHEADKMDPSGRMGLILRVMLAFGLRRKEALCCYPWKSGFTGTSWSVYPSESKGARPRLIPIQTPEQYAVLALVKSKIKKNDRLRWEYKMDGSVASLTAAENRFKGYMERLGLTKKVLGGTGHGLRAEYAENSAIVAGMVAPTLGGNGAEFDKEERNMIRMAVSELMGHSRVEITNAYYGKFKKNSVELTPEEYCEAMRGGIAEMERLGLVKSRPLELKADCLRILDALETVGADMSHSQVFALWTQYSERHAVLWVKPQDTHSIIAAMYVAATKHLRQRDLELKKQRELEAAA